MRRAVRTKRPGPAASRRFEDIQWLNNVREVRHSLDSNHPISVREVLITSGEASPQPTVPFPERHPFCELNIALDGLMTQFIGDEKVERHGGDVMLLGPGVPHYALRRSCPHQTVTVYFLPLVLFQLGPSGDGAWLLSRFASPQGIDQRVVRPPEKIRARLLEQMRAMAREYREHKPGSELRLWGMLIAALVDFVRWETDAGRWRASAPHLRDWPQLEKALRYLHEHFAEPIYIDQVAHAIGATPNHLRDLFRKSLGMSCSHYLHSLRIAQAKSRLCLPNAQVTEIALSVGFETLSHFNTSFRKLTGVSPTQYMRSQGR